MGENISKEQLKNILNTYFIENEVTALVIPDDTSTSNAELTSKQRNYKIKLSDIYSCIFSSNRDNTVVEPTDIYVAWCYNGALVFSNNQDDIDTYVSDNNTTVFDAFGNIKDIDYDPDNLPNWAYDGGVSKVVFLNPIAPKSTAWWFCGLNELSTIENINYLNTSNVTNMSGMFCSGAYQLTSLDLRGFDTRNVTDMSYMFESWIELTTIYVSNSFVTSNVTNDTDMFRNCTSLVGGNGTAFDSSKIGKSMAHIDVSGNPGYFTEN